MRQDNTGPDNKSTTDLWILVGELHRPGSKQRSRRELIVAIDDQTKPYSRTI